MTTKNLFIVLFIAGTVATANAQYPVRSTPVDTTGAEAVQLCQVIVREGGQWSHRSAAERAVCLLSAVDGCKVVRVSA
jgi:hypothetical protein